MNHECKCERGTGQFSEVISTENCELHKGNVNQGTLSNQEELRKELEKTGFWKSLSLMQQGDLMFFAEAYAKHIISEQEARHREETERVLKESWDRSVDEGSTWDLGSALEAIRSRRSDKGV